MTSVFSEGGLSSKKSKWSGVGHQPSEGNKTDGIRSRLSSYRTMRKDIVEDLSHLILKKGVVLLHGPP